MWRNLADFPTQTHRHMDTEKSMDMRTDMNTDMDNFYQTNKLVMQNLQHLAIGATESLAPSQWCKQYAALINKIVKRYIFFCWHHLYGAKDSAA